MQKYEVTLRIEEVDSIKTFDIGEKIKFNIQDGVKSYSTKIVDVEIENKNQLKIVCFLDKKHYEDFNSCDYTRDWCDFDLEKCIINDLDFIGEYVC